jgi:hypothetical protein
MVGNQTQHAPWGHLQLASYYYCFYAFLPAIAAARMSKEAQNVLQKKRKGSASCNILLLSYKIPVLPTFPPQLFLHVGHQIQHVLQIEALNNYPRSLSSKYLLRALALMARQQQQQHLHLPHPHHQQQQHHHHQQAPQGQEQQQQHVHSRHYHHQHQLQMAHPLVPFLSLCAARALTASTTYTTTNNTNTIIGTDAALAQALVQLALLHDVGRVVVDEGLGVGRSTECRDARQLGPEQVHDAGIAVSGAGAGGVLELCDVAARALEGQPLSQQQQQQQQQPQMSLRPQHAADVVWALAKIGHKPMGGM